MFIYYQLFLHVFTEKTNKHPFSLLVGPWNLCCVVLVRGTAMKSWISLYFLGLLRGPVCARHMHQRKISHAGRLCVAFLGGRLTMKSQSSWKGDAMDTEKDQRAEREWRSLNQLFYQSKWARIISPTLTSLCPAFWLPDRFSKSKWGGLVVLADNSCQPGDFTGEYCLCCLNIDLLVFHDGHETSVARLTAGGPSCPQYRHPLGWHELQQHLKLYLGQIKYFLKNTISVLLRTKRSPHLMHLRCKWEIKKRTINTIHFR